MSNFEMKLVNKSNDQSFLKRLSPKLLQDLPSETCIREIDMQIKTSLGKKNKKVLLFPSAIYVFKNSKVLKKKIELNFMLRVECIYSKPREEQIGKLAGFNFIIENEKFSLSSKNEETLDFFYQFLATKIIFKGLRTRFEEKRMLGKGNYSQVALMKDLCTGGNYAVKKICRETLLQTKNEILILRKVDHPNIPKLYSVFEENGSFFLILEFFKGKTLIDFIRSRGKFLSESESVQILDSLMESLVYLHENGIMHRDVKPENIVILNDEIGGFSAKLIDFGLAERIDSTSFITLRCGTPGFVAPEIVNARPGSENYDCVCDVFSAGIVFHLMLLGCCPFMEKKSNVNEVLAKNKACKIDYELEKYTKLSSENLLMLKRMLDPSPNSRISSSQCHNFTSQDYSHFNAETEAFSDFQEDIQCIERMEKNMMMLSGKFH